MVRTSNTLPAKRGFQKVPFLLGLSKGAASLFTGDQWVPLQMGPMERSPINGPDGNQHAMFSCLHGTNGMVPLQMGLQNGAVLLLDGTNGLIRSSWARSLLTPHSP